MAKLVWEYSTFQGNLRGTLISTHQFSRMKQSTTDDTDFTDKTVRTSRWTIPQDIRVISEIRGLLQSAEH
jgi:hypothetical protein